MFPSSVRTKDEIRVRRELQGGLIIKIDFNLSLNLPSGTIHMTMTTGEGILVGITYVSAEAYSESQLMRG